MTFVIKIKIEAPIVEAHLANIARTLEAMLEFAERQVRPQQPGEFEFKPNKQEREGDMLKMVGNFQFPAADPNAGVQARRFIVKNAEELVLDEELPGDATSSSEVRLPVGATIHAELTDVDQAANASVPRAADFTVTDTVAPPQPGEFAFSASSQVDE